MHTQHDGLVETWKVHIKGKHYLRVFMWDKVESLRIGLQKAFPDLDPETQAYAAQVPYAVKVSGDGPEKRFPPKFGEVHLHVNMSGSGTVAHELQHILSYWIIAHGLDLNDYDDNEEAAQLADEMTSQYWIGYYDHFE